MAHTFQTHSNTFFQTLFHFLFLFLISYKAVISSAIRSRTLESTYPLILILSLVPAVIIAIVLSRTKKEKLYRDSFFLLCISAVLETFGLFDRISWGKNNLHIFGKTDVAFLVDLPFTVLLIALVVILFAAKKTVPDIYTKNTKQ